MSEWGGKRSGSGRPKGRLNNKTSDLIERIEAKYPNWCPIEHLVRIANDKETPLELKIHCCTKAASYIYSKPKISIETSDKSNIIEAIMAGRKRAGLSNDDVSS